jgi:hypothetical protein
MKIGFLEVPDGRLVILKICAAMIAVLDRAKKPVSELFMRPVVRADSFDGHNVVSSFERNLGRKRAR